MDRARVILLDTHVLVWMDADTGGVGRTSRRLIQQAWQERQLAVSAISFWECAMLLQRQRIDLRRGPAEWRRALLANGLIEVPIDGDIALLATTLESFPKDPADRFIAATAMTLNATLVTADAPILGWRSPLRRQNAGR